MTWRHRAAAAASNRARQWVRRLRIALLRCHLADLSHRRAVHLQHAGISLAEAAAIRNRQHRAMATLQALQAEIGALGTRWTR